MFKIDDRDVQAQLLPALAKINEAEANLASARSRLKLAESVPDKRAISLEDLTNRRSAVAIDEAALASAKAQLRLSEINANNRTYFCGSYFKYAFHEDALASALDVCRAITGRPIWLDKV